jgi:hypothetical protein
MAALLGTFGVPFSFLIPMPRQGNTDFALAADWTPVAGDCRIVRDGAAPVALSNLPTAVTIGNTAGWLFSLTAAEMEANQIDVVVADAATKAVQDQWIEITTVHPGTLHQGRVTAGAATGCTLAATAIDAVNRYRFCQLDVIAGAGAGQSTTIAAQASGRVISFDRTLETALDATSCVRISGLGLQGLSQAEVEAAILDAANGIEAGLTLRQALRGFAATLLGKKTGSGTATEVFRNAVADTKPRVTATVDNAGNRTAITFDGT